MRSIKQKPLDDTVLGESNLKIGLYDSGSAPDPKN